MSQPSSGTWFSDSRGYPSRWIALFLAIMFGLGAVVVALLGEGYPVTAVLGFLFVVCFDAAFGRRSVAVQVACAFAQRDKRSNRSGG
jgi:hypothetical protein